LATSPINRNAYVQHVLYLAEEIVKIFITHLERHVANEKGFGRLVWSGGLAGNGAVATTVVLNCHTATLEELRVESLESGGRVFLVGELDVTEAGAGTLAYQQ